MDDPSSRSRPRKFNGHEAYSLKEWADELAREAWKAATQSTGEDERRAMRRHSMALGMAELARASSGSPPSPPSPREARPTDPLQLGNIGTFTPW